MIVLSVNTAGYIYGKIIVVYIWRWDLVYARNDKDDGSGAK